MDATTTGRTNLAKSSGIPKNTARQTQAAEIERGTQRATTAATHANPLK